MPKHPNAASDADLLPERKKPWRTKQPSGLYVVEKGISKETAAAVWEFFHPPEGFEWKQRFGARFPKTAHFNHWRSGSFVGREEQRRFKREYNALYKMCEEAVASLQAHLHTLGDHSLDDFVGESVNVHLHEPGWGLGPHYDDAHDPGNGKVVMVTLSAERLYPRGKRRPRVFRFTDPVLGRKFDLQTWCRQVLVFKGPAYDGWCHESVRDWRQTGACLSFTIRQHNCDGSTNAADDRAYPKGAPAAAKIAHKRLREKYGPDFVQKLIDEAAVAKAEADTKKAERDAKRAKKQEEKKANEQAARAEQAQAA